MEGLGDPGGRPRGLATWLEGFRTQTMLPPGASATPATAALQPAATTPCRRRAGAGDRTRASGRPASAGPGAAGCGGGPGADRRRNRVRAVRHRHRARTGRGQDNAQRGRVVAGRGHHGPRRRGAASTDHPGTDRPQGQRRDGPVPDPGGGCPPPRRDRAGRGTHPGGEVPGGPLGGQRRPQLRNAQHRRALATPTRSTTRPPGATGPTPTSTTWASTTGRRTPPSGWPTPRSIPAARSFSRHFWTIARSSPPPSGSTRPCR